MAWYQELQGASFRGIPFVVTETDYQFGRRTVVHEYPMRDDPWVEDLGRASRTIAITGFLVGDDVYEQRDALREAAETQGVGELVHPSRGTMHAVLLSASFGEAAERGRTVSLNLNFIRVSDQQQIATGLYPTIGADTQATTVAVAGDANYAAAADYAAALGTPTVLSPLAPLAQGVAVVNTVAATVTGYTTRIQLIVGDASRIVNSVRGLETLAGSRLALGRYGGTQFGANPVVAGVDNTLSAVSRVAAGVQSALSAATAARAQVGSLTATTVTLANVL